MKHQPKLTYQSNDVVYTPLSYAGAIVRYFKPSGRILEPCSGGGAFLEYMPDAMSCEIDNGSSFFLWHDQVDWIVTNPPWSKFQQFLLHSLNIATHIVFLVTVNHLWTKARIRMVRERGYGIRHILTMDTPPEFPQSGFQLGVIHLERGYCGPSIIEHLEPCAADDLEAGPTSANTQRAKCPQLAMELEL